MIHLHLTKYWFNKIKSGEKKSEFRPMIYFYENLIHNEMKRINPSIKFYLGYPDKNDKDKSDYNKRFKSLCECEFVDYNRKIYKIIDVDFIKYIEFDEGPYFNIFLKMVLIWNYIKFTWIE